jgi:hypothetical protein
MTCTARSESATRDIPCDKHLYSYWGKASGASVGQYDVPEDLPRNQEIQIDIEIARAGKIAELNEEYGEAWLVVTKVSDL